MCTVLCALMAGRARAVQLPLAAAFFQRRSCLVVLVVVHILVPVLLPWFRWELSPASSLLAVQFTAFYLLETIRSRYWCWHSTTDWRIMPDLLLVSSRVLCVVCSSITLLAAVGGSRCYWYYYLIGRGLASPNAVDPGPHCLLPLGAMGLTKLFSGATQLWNSLDPVCSRINCKLFATCKGNIFRNVFDVAVPKQNPSADKS